MGGGGGEVWGVGGGGWGRGGEGGGGGRWLFAKLLTSEILRAESIVCY